MRWSNKDFFFKLMKKSENRNNRNETKKSRKSKIVEWKQVKNYSTRTTEVLKLCFKKLRFLEVLGKTAKVVTSKDAIL